MRDRFAAVPVTVNDSLRSRFQYEIVAHVGATPPGQTAGDPSIFLRSLEANGFTGRVVLAGAKDIDAKDDLDLHVSEPDWSTNPFGGLR